MLTTRGRTLVLLGEVGGCWKDGLRNGFFDEGLHINIDMQVTKSLFKRVDRQNCHGRLLRGCRCKIHDLNDGEYDVPLLHKL
jgi:hypothetical protein